MKTLEEIIYDTGELKARKRFVAGILSLVGALACFLFGSHADIPAMFYAGFLFAIVSVLGFTSFALTRARLFRGVYGKSESEMNEVAERIFTEHD